MSDVASTCSLEMFKSVMRGGSRLDEEAAAAIASYLHGKLNEDGGFRGRSPASDLYYSVFGMTTLSALGVEFPLDRTWRYLEGFGDGAALDFVHLTCLLRCRAICRFMGGQESFPADHGDKDLLARIEAFRAGCGGYHQSVRGAARGTVYASFLANCAYEDAAVELPEAAAMIRSVEGLRCNGGGYANEALMESGTTTATAAALVLLKKAGAEVDPSVTGWLLSRGARRGGFLAGEKAKMPDLLSTATVLHALRTVGASLEGREAACREFIDLLWMDDGGFAGSLFDLTTDCEYTFYALLGLGSLE